jgi:predicted outer membrane repeat protein
MRRHTPIVLMMLVCMVIGLSSWPPSVVQAATTIQVDPSVNDANDNSDGKCSLYEALQAIGQGSSYNNCQLNGNEPYTITFTNPGTLKVIDGSLPFITKIVNITGPVIIEGNGKDRIFTVASSGMLNIANLTLRKGSPAIQLNNASSSLNVAGVSFIDNANSGNGGAISSVGRVNIAGSLFTANSADGSDGGGAIWAAGTDQLNIGGTIFSGNVAKRSGGAIYATAPANLVDVVFNGNIANGIDPNNNGSDNDENDDYRTQGGGAIAVHNDGSNDRKLSLTRAVFSGNITGQGNGGALFVNTGAVVEIQDSAFNGNVAGKLPNVTRLGGAIANLGGRLTMVRSTLLTNAVIGDGGALANDQNGTATLANLTLTANAATGRGGALFNANVLSTNAIPRMTVRNTTLTLNAAATAGGAVFASSPSSSEPNVARFANTILAGSDGDGLGGNCAGSGVFSEGHNLDSGTSCGFSATGDLSTMDPQLKEIMFNGGPLPLLLSIEPQPGSPVIDAGNTAICAAEPVANRDTRGTARPIGVRCDIGSYEAPEAVPGFGATPVAPGPISFGNVQFGQNQSTSLSVFNTGTAPLTVSNPQIGGANAADFALTSSLPITLGIDGTSTLTVRCQPTGTTPGARVGNLSFATNDPSQPTVTYMLVCNATAVPVAGFDATPALPGPIDLGTLVIGASAARTLTVREVGTAPLNLGTAQISGDAKDDFSIIGLPGTIANGGASVDATITCTPTVPGLRSATLSFSTNDPNIPTATFALSCSGRMPPVAPLESTGPGVISGPTAGNAGPYGLALSPDGQHLYAADQGDSLVAAFRRNPNTGALTAINTYDDGATGGPNLAFPMRVLTSPDGRNVYATSTTDSGLTAFARDPETGELTLLDSVRNGQTIICRPNCSTISGMAGAYGMAISPDGQFIYVSSTADNSVVQFRRGPDGSLIGGSELIPIPRFVERVTHPGILAAYDIAISPDGAQLYVAGYLSGNITIFARNIVDGRLTYQQTLSNTDIPSLIGVFRLTFSPDGKQLYTASYGGGITVLARNPVDGSLSFRQAWRESNVPENTPNRLDTLRNATSISISADGNYAYVTGFSSNSLLVFERNQATGELLFAQAIQRNEQTELPAIRGARDVVVTSDGRTVYVSGFFDDRIVRLRFNNPTPTISSLNPASTAAGTAELLLTINGADFVPGAVVQWDGSDLPTTFVSSSELQVLLTADLLNSARVVPLVVANPLPGGGASNEVRFTITAADQNPVPAIHLLTPNGTVAGDGPLQVQITGSGFLPASVARWNGQPRTTTYLSPTVLEIALSVADLAQPGTSAISVINPAPGGGTSNNFRFSVAAPWVNPPPSIRSLNPASLTAGVNPAVTVRVLGNNFVPGAQATWNGAARPTTFVTAQEVQVALNSADLLQPGTASIMVTNPLPGGGPSNTATFVLLAPGVNPLPVLSSVIATSSGANGGRIVRLRGHDFVNGVSVHWNGQPRPTTRTNATEVRVTLSAADLAGGTGVFTVINPGPGGGSSTNLIYTIQRLWVPLLRR